MAQLILMRMYGKPFLTRLVGVLCNLEIEGMKQLSIWLLQPKVPKSSILMLAMKRDTKQLRKRKFWTKNSLMLGLAILISVSYRTISRVSR